MWSDECLCPFDVSENLRVKTELPAGGADEHRNASEYQLNSANWNIRSGELNLV
jgi:hypothetical protein